MVSCVRGEGGEAGQRGYGAIAAKSSDKLLVFGMNRSRGVRKPAGCLSQTGDISQQDDDAGCGSMYLGAVSDGDKTGFQGGTSNG